MDKQKTDSAAVGPQGQFTHLHLHTSYSLLDGAIRIPDLMAHVKGLGMESVAMTDHGNMFGAIEFYKAAVAQGIKPIIGNEFYVAPGGRKETRVVEKLADGNNYHLILLAQNAKGYANLIRLTSRSYTEGFYRKPRIDYELLEQHSEGLVCLTACLGGEVQRKLMLEKYDEAAALAGKLQEIFGKDRFFLEIQNHGLADELQVARGNLEISRRNNIPLALTNDSHFLTRQSHAAQDILLRINSKKRIDEDLLFGFNPEFYVKSAAEMALLFPEIPDAFHNTQLIADSIDLNFDFGNPLLPRFEVPANHNLDSYMRELTLSGLKRRYPDMGPAVMERFEFEYETITRMDFSGYFLIVQDFINWAKSQDIPVGPGRGSAAGSIVAYGLGITDIDPLRYDLLFERFLNPDRKEMPDIDVDFCTERREEVINYARDKYGHDRVGQIVTYGTMAAKACLKDVARVLNISFDEANQISKKFPDVLNITIEEALSSSSELRAYADSGEIQKKLFTVAKELQGNARQTGVHAAGVVIAPAPLEDIVPMATVNAKTAGKGAANKERVLVTQYDKDALESVGLVKMDFLGLRNLTVLHRAVGKVKRRLGVNIDVAGLPLDDPKAYALLQKGDVKGVFQLESSSGMREFVLRMKPTRFEEIIAVIALFRPGPLQSGMADSYINRKNGKERIRYAHPDLEEVLGDTYGVIVYQEQVMLISRKIGGFTPGESDALRKAMGKKITEKMEQMRIKFVEGAVSKGYAQKFAEDLYEQMAQFAHYGFNKSHSAAYAMVVYQTAYMKANYPTDYMCAVLDSELDKTEKLVPYINAVRDMGIELLGPDVNESEANFSCVKDGVIRFGMAGIKNVGLQAVESMVEGRATAKYTSLFQFLENVDLRFCNRRTLESLIYAGAFSSLGYTRRALIEGLEMGIQHAQRMQADRQVGQASLFGGQAAAALPSQEPIPRGEHVTEFPEPELLRLEKEVLGFYFSGHPLARFARTLRNIKSPPIEDLQQYGGKKIEVAGVISEISIRVTKTNREMARLVLEDMTGRVHCTVFPAAFERIRRDLVSDRPILLKGMVEKNQETGTAQLLVDDAAPLSRELLEEKMEKSFHVKLQRSAVDGKVIQQLQSILRGFSGRLQVFFHLVPDGVDLEAKEVPEGYQVIRAHESFSVEYNQELIDRLRRVKCIRGIYLSVGGQYRQVHDQPSPAPAKVG